MGFYGGDCFWILVLAASGFVMASNDKALGSIRTRRLVQETRQVPLFLSLFYVNHDTAQPLEGKNLNNALVAHLCQSVNAQVSADMYPKCPVPDPLS